MANIKVLDVKDILSYRERLIQYIFESYKNTVYMESYSYKDAGSKYDDLLLYVNDKKAIVYGAIEENELIGFVWAYKFPFRDDKSRFYIGILHINEKYRNMHIGRQLLYEIENYAKEIDIHAIYLHAEVCNTGAVKFYRRNGYRVERIQLVKKRLDEWQQDDENNAKITGEGVYELKEADIRNFNKSLIELFMINTSAHILTDCFDEIWAKKKIEELEGYVKESKAIVYGFFQKRNLIGFIWVFPYAYKGQKRYLLNAITVFPEYRGNNIADKLFRSIENHLRNQVLYTLVDKANERAYRFYQNQGMKEEAYQFVKVLKR